MANGLFSVWVQCPLRAANKVAQKKRIKIGWTVARVELLMARPTQCYRCWQYGHLRHDCKAQVDRSRCCYRYGQEGHAARECVNLPRCALCEEKGRNGEHRLGTAQCEASKEFGRGRRKNGLDRSNMGYTSRNAT